MSKQEEIKQALAAATPGPWAPASSYASDSEEPDGIILWAEIKDRPGAYTGVCEFHPDTFVKDEDVNLIAKAPEYIAYLLEQVEKQPELWECPGCGFTYAAEHEDIDPVTGEGNGNHTCPLCELIDVERERDRLRKELEEKDAALAVWARKEIEWHENVEGLRDLLHKISDAEWEESMDSHFNDVFTTRTINPAQIANEALDFVGQEGEGNQ